MPLALLKIQTLKKKVVAMEAELEESKRVRFTMPVNHLSCSGLCTLQLLKPFFNTNNAVVAVVFGLQVVQAAICGPRAGAKGHVGDARTVGRAHRGAHTAALGAAERPLSLVHRAHHRALDVREARPRGDGEEQSRVPLRW